MPRVNRVKKCRIDQGRCIKCGDEIKKGDPYRWWKFRYGGRRVVCMKSECSPSASDLTQSPFLSLAYEAEGLIAEALSQLPEDAASLLRDASEMLREAGEIRREAAENIESGFGHMTEQAYELQEQGDSAECWAEELESLADELDSYDDEREDWIENNPDDPAEALQMWVENKVSEAEAGNPGVW